MRFVAPAAPVAMAAAAAALVCGARPAAALNKQGERAPSTQPSSEATALAPAPPPPFELSGYLFSGGFLYNPTYFARPNNTGLALLRFGLHLDLDLWDRRLTLSYDENSFTDRAPDRRSLLLPTEDDHIVGLLSSWPLGGDLALTGAVHYETDRPWTEANAAYRAAHPDCGPAVSLAPPDCYQAGFSQSYVDTYGRLEYAHERTAAYAALGLFAWNPSYAARPDNSGLALLRYVLHGERRVLPWLALRLDLNFFTDRDENPLRPSELDTLAQVAFLWRAWELHLDGEIDAPLGSYPAGGPHPASPRPGVSQYYVALLLQWSFHAPLPGRWFGGGR